MSDIYNDVVRVEGEELPQDIVDRIQYLKVQFVYEYGRDKKDKKVVRIKRRTGRKIYKRS